MIKLESAILACLARVAEQRRLRSLDAKLSARVAVVKAYQHGRFQQSYADLIQNPRFAAATTFFLEDLYGAADFSKRDAQFVRIVPALVRLFPRDIAVTVARLGELHALSEELDTEMARAMQFDHLDGESYGRAWRTAGREPDREAQIAMMIEVGSQLDRYTRSPILRHTLRLMRQPASVAGLGELQAFLERGFDAFKSMGGAAEFLQTIEARERGLSRMLFAGGAIGDG